MTLILKIILLILQIPKMDKFLTVPQTLFLEPMEQAQHFGKVTFRNANFYLVFLKII